MLVTCGCGSPTEYNCNTCGAKLCANCKQAHLENNDTRHHSITEYANKLMPGSLSPPPCHEHNGKECVCFCQTCGKAACIDCVIKSHRGHEFAELETILQDKRATLQKELKNLESIKLKEWQDLMEEAKKMTSDFLGQVDSIEKKLEERAKEFHTRVEEIKENYKKQLNEMKKSNLDILQKQEKMVSEGLEKVKLEIKECEDQLRSSDMGSLLEHEDAKSDKKDPPQKLSCVTPPVFTQNQIDTKALTEMFGQLTQRTPKPSVQSQFDTKTDSPSVICVGSGEAWVRTDTKTIQLVDRHGEVKDTIHTDFNFGDMVLSPQGDILLSDWDNNCIKAISGDMTIKTLFKLQWTPSGLCCLHTGDIVVTFFWDGHVVIYSASGKVIKELNKKLFTRPYRVAQSKVNSDLYISDAGRMGAGKVVALDKDYRVRYEYTGQGDGKYSFSPCGLCTDKAGHILITDSLNHRVHILDRDGQFRQFLLTGEQGLRGPYSIDVDSEGNPWVGEEGGGVKVVKYLQ